MVRLVLVWSLVVVLLGPSPSCEIFSDGQIMRWTGNKKVGLGEGGVAYIYIYKSSGELRNVLTGFCFCVRGLTSLRCPLFSLFGVVRTMVKRGASSHAQAHPLTRFPNDKVPRSSALAQHCARPCQTFRPLPKCTCPALRTRLQY